MKRQKIRGEVANLEVEHGSFTSLIMSLSDGVVNAAKKTATRGSYHFNLKKNRVSLNTTLTEMRCKLSCNHPFSASVVHTMQQVPSKQVDLPTNLVIIESGITI